MSNEIEIWKDIPNYEGLYQVSSFGRVKSLNYNHTKKAKLLKPSIVADKYLMAVLSKELKQKGHYVHQLVAMAFLGHKPDKYNLIIDHIDNNPLNNYAINLKIVSARQNTSKDRKGGSSKYIGVCWVKNRNKWMASIWFKERRIHLGVFKKEIDAANAYQKALKELNHGLDLNIIYPKKVLKIK